MSLQSACKNSLITSPSRNSSISISSPECKSQLTVESSPCWDSDKAPGSSSISSPPSNDTSSSSTKAMQSCAELVQEIFGLEAEIVKLERHLLSLYRTALIKHLPTLSDSTKSLQCNSELLAHYKECDTLSIVERSKRAFDHRVFHSLSLASNNSLSSASTPRSLPGKKSIDSGHRSLADHLGTSCMSDIGITPDRVSENIARCMSAIYCKISDPSLTMSQVAEKHTGPYGTMREVVKVHLNDDNFKYASTLLQRVRSMIQLLEKIDPRTMKREGKLAFWINIHNALMMHAYLAYGTRDRVKDRSFFKAAYNIGGHFINAYMIQTSIFGLRPHYSAPWLQLVLSSKKFDRGSSKHIYALEYPEPLVYFALSSGALSDPAVRAYSGSDIFQSLKLAKDEFLQANVFIDKESKVFLPKILYYFAKDMALDVSGILKVVDESVSRDQQKAIKKCIKGRRPQKFLHWLSHSSSFRYLIHEESSTQIPKS